MTYSNWAIALTNFYFNEKSAQKRVRLMLDANLLDHSFSDLGGSEGFIESMHSGPEWLISEGQELYEICSYLHRLWGNRNKPEGYPELKNNAPPFLPYLCLFSYAWTIEGFHAGNFTKRLETIFPNHGLKKNQNMKWCTDHLWKGLSEWSAENEGKLGVFKIDRLGSRAHVDISRAQTIFRPAEIELLPDIFTACGLSPEDSDDINDIHEALVFNKQSWSYRLSSALPPLIINWDTSKDPIAEAALEIISEELAKWDGESNQPTTRYQPSIKIHRSLKDNNGNLSLDLCVLDDDVAKLSKLELFSDEQLIGQFKTDGPRIAILQGASETWDPYFIGKSLNGTAQSHDDDFGDEKHICKWIPRSISLFQIALPDGRMVEANSPPRAGECICLVSPDGEKAFNSWIKKCPSDPSTLIPINGLKEAWRIYRLSKLEHLDMDSFPLERRASNTRHLIKLTGGTRLSLDSYMEYDLPILSAIESGITFEIIGARLKEISIPVQIQTQWNSDLSQQYSLEDYDRNGEILITAKQGGYSQDFTIKVKQSAELPGHLRRHDSTFHVNKLGWPDQQGLRGCRVSIVDGNINAHKFYKGPNFEIQSLQLNQMQSERFNFLEKLSLKKRFNYSKLKKEALCLCSTSQSDFSRAIRLIRDLGDVDTEVDGNGYICYVYPNPAELVLMPWKKGEDYVAALRGTYTKNAFSSYINAAKKLEIEFECVDVGIDLEKYLPPTVYFKSNDLNKFDQICRETNLLEWRNSVACRVITEWSADLDQWSKTLSTRPTRESFGDYEKIYDVDQFRFKDSSNANRAKQRYELFLITIRHGRFKPPPIINLRKSTQEHGEWKTEIDITTRDPAWAKWYIQGLDVGPRSGQGTLTHRNAGPRKDNGKLTFHHEEIDTAAIIFMPDRKQLLIPRELPLPYVLSRALTLCTASPPIRVKGVETDYIDIVGNFRGLSNRNGYKGEVWVYSGVSREMAEIISAKVGAIPVKRRHLIFTAPTEILSEYY